ncbi:MAG: cell division protein FtsB [Pseudomonadales bacterium]|nr:cell division protein FtsB [Pseudomonadales bacterium]MCP5171405.1 cell division protein FtsB [Pseudomonadales bacterium]
MRWLTIILAVLFLLLQYRLWVGEGSLAQKVALENKVAEQLEENQHLRDRNQVLANEVSDLKNGLEGVEELARKDLGMVKKGETFYMVIEKPEKENSEKSQ